MPAAQDQRPRYYEGQYLSASDLSAAVTYAQVHEARLLLGPHTWGIATGLQIEEVPTAEGGDARNVFVLPGYAWDGFGRTTVVLAPYKVPTDLFQSYLYDSANPDGLLIDLWLQYDETGIREAKRGFDLCAAGDLSSRVLETFRLVIGRYEREASLRDTITVAGRSIDANDAFRAFVPTAALLSDGSVPFQAFPEDDARARWLIPLGCVRWQPNQTAGQLGRFVKRSHRDHEASRARRVYIGAVAESLLAADGILRMADRTRDYRTRGLSEHDFVRIEGAVRAQGDFRLWGTQVDFRDSNGHDQGTSFLLRRTDDAKAGTKALDVQIGAATAGKTRFGVGPRNKDGTVDEVFYVLDNGYVSIGSDSTDSALDVKGNVKVSGDAVKPGGGSWTVVSDISLKQNIRAIDDALGQVLRLRGVSFEWKDPKSMGNLTGPQTGLIAQEVEAVLPGWVRTGSDGLKQLTVRGFEALAVEAIRALQNQNQALQARVEALEAQQRAAGSPPVVPAKGPEPGPSGGASKSTPAPGP
jgi:hypothetical protein